MLSILSHHYHHLYAIYSLSSLLYFYNSFTLTHYLHNHFLSFFTTFNIYSSGLYILSYIFFYYRTTILIYPFLQFPLLSYNYYLLYVIYPSLLIYYNWYNHHYKSDTSSSTIFIYYLYSLYNLFYLSYFYYFYYLLYLYYFISHSPISTLYIITPALFLLIYEITYYNWYISFFYHLCL